MGRKVIEIYLEREEGFERKCKKTRAEHLEVIAKESPHYTKDYAWFLGRLFEMSAVKNASEFVNESEMNMWRLDYARMKRMMMFYKIPDVTHISVDEVYARKKSRYEGESGIGINGKLSLKFHRKTLQVEGVFTDSLY